METTRQIELVTGMTEDTQLRVFAIYPQLMKLILWDIKHRKALMEALKDCIDTLYTAHNDSEKERNEMARLAEVALKAADKDLG